MSRKLVSALKVLFILYLSIGLIIWFVSPWVVNYFAKPVLAQQNLALTDTSSIRFNPFLTKVAINELGLHKLPDDQANTALFIEQASIELSLWRLINDDVYISELIFDGIKLSANISDEYTEIAGVTIPQGETTVADERTETEKSEAESVTHKPDYRLVLNHIEIKNSSINIDYSGVPHQVIIDQILVQDSLLSKHAQKLALSLNLNIDKQPIKLESTASIQNQIGDASLALSVEKLGLAQFSHFVFPNSEQQDKPSGQIDSGELSFEIEQAIKLTPNELNSTIESVALALDNVAITTQGVTANLENHSVTGDSLGVKIDLLSPQAPIAELTGQLALMLSNVHLYTESESQTLVKVAGVSSSDISLSVVDSQPTVSIPSVTIENADFSDDLEDEIPSLARFSQMDILTTQVSAAGLSIKQINIAGFGIDVKRANDKRILGLVLPGSNTENNEQLTEPEQEQVENKEQLEQQAEIAEAIEDRTEMEAEDKYPMSIDEITLVGESHINIFDESVDPIYHRNFDVETLTVGPLDNQQVDLMTHLKLKGSSNNFSYFDFDADMKLYAEQPYYKLSGLFKEVNLPELSSYLKDVLQYEFNNGQLDVELDVEIDNTDIDGNTNIFLRNVELAAADNHEGSAVEDSGAIPFNLALGMLKDGDGNVNLDVPLKGSTDSPDFSLQGFVVLLMKKATMSAAKEYLITTFVPYANVVKVGLSASDYLLKVSFNDLPYDVANSHYNEDAEAFISQFSAFMQDKEDVTIKVCAFAVPSDIGVNKVDGELSKRQLGSLKELSIERMQKFKRHMVSEKNIASSRLLLCTPKVDTAEDAVPRLTFAE